jgi:hypothetical protein
MEMADALIAVSPSTATELTQLCARGGPWRSRGLPPHGVDAHPAPSLGARGAWGHREQPLRVKGRGRLCWAASPCLGSSWGGICGCGLGLGLLLHWLVPAIDRGMATLCGLVATGVALLAFGQLMTLAEPLEAEDESPPLWRLRSLPRPSRATRRPRKRPGPQGARDARQRCGQAPRPSRHVPGAL